MAVWITLSSILLATTVVSAILPSFNPIAGPSELNTTMNNKIPNYNRHPTKVNPMVEVHGVCGSNHGKFAAVSFKKSKQHMCVFDFYGKLLKDIRLPYPDKMSDCAFISPDLMLLCDYSGTKIYKMTTNGQYKGVFVDGIRCIRMLYIKGYLYVTEDRHDKVIIYDVSTGRTLFDFDSRCSGGARGLAFDTARFLYLSCGRYIKKFTYDGKYISQKRYPHFHNADGIAIDADNNIVITSRNPSSTVVVYSPSGRLIRKYNSFKSAADVAIVYKQNRCPTLVLADNGSGTSGNVKVYTG